MMHHSLHKPSARTSSNKQEKHFVLAPRPFAIQAKQEAYHPNGETVENEAFRQNQFEALGLQCKQEHGTITPIELEQLGVLQAKLDDFWVQRQQQTARTGYKFANISIRAPEHPVNPIAPSIPGQLAQRQGELSGKPQMQSVSLLQPASTIQRAHQKGKSRKIEAQQGRNAAKRDRKKQEAAQQQQASEEWSNTVSSWASWAWDSAKSIGATVIKKASGGIDPFEVAATLRNAYNANVSITTKIQYLALYGSYQVSQYLNANMATLIGGDVGAMMEMEEQVNEYIEKLSNLWETGEMDEGEVQEGIADKILEALG